ncbi:hypothetical protein V1522DRAFT_269960 [Lipomyces starkeyi]
MQTLNAVFLVQAVGQTPEILATHPQQGIGMVTWCTPLVVAVEIGVSQAYESLRAAISFSVCALRCRVGITMCINKRVRGTAPVASCYELEELFQDASTTEGLSLHCHYPPDNEPFDVVKGSYDMEG